MQNFDNKLIKAEKALDNIRGYLWESWYFTKIKRNRKNPFKQKFLER
jgi:hypothetical protein